MYMCVVCIRLYVCECGENKQFFSTDTSVNASAAFRVSSIVDRQFTHHYNLHPLFDIRLLGSTLFEQIFFNKKNHLIIVIIPVDNRKLLGKFHLHTSK